METRKNRFMSGRASVTICPTEQEAGRAAAKVASKVITDAVESRGRARIIVATGNSQREFIEALVALPNVPWEKVEAFHMDEYVGIAPSHPASFRHWLKTYVEDRVPLKSIQYIQGDADDLDSEIERYTKLLSAGSIDAAFVGIGENGHIAFNDPDNAAFEDPKMLKIVKLEEASLRQQVGEGHFPDIDSVPKEAVTISCSGLFRANNWICCVPEKRKANAVKKALEGSLGTDCPATLVRTHPAAFLFLDKDSASELSEQCQV